MNIILCGANGAMGKDVQDLVKASDDITISAGIDKNPIQDTDFKQYSKFNYEIQGDVIIDFSHHSMTESLLDHCEKTKCPAVICTTALSEKTNSRIMELSSKVAFFKSANMSLGIHVLINLVKAAYKSIGDDFDIEIIEKHHNKKIDAPSGTANMIAQSINSVSNDKFNYVYGREGNNSKRTNNEIGIHSIRGGSIVGEHDIIFSGLDEIIEIKHTATSKMIFAKGAIEAAKFLIGKPAGMYSMSDMM